jgi:hypothetical protein
MRLSTRFTNDAANKKVGRDSRIRVVAFAWLRFENPWDAGSWSAPASEDDGTRTRNLRIDSPAL